jgi:hypothetical protein
MKGFFVKAIEKLVIEETGLMQREHLLNKAGFKPNELFIIRTDIEDTKVKKLITAAKKILDATDEKFYDSYGKFWVNEYASVIFKQIFTEAETSKEFLTELFKIHADELNDNNIKVSDKLSAESPDEKTLIINYKDKVLIKLIEGIVKHLTQKYKEKADIKATQAKVTITY